MRDEVWSDAAPDSDHLSKFFKEAEEASINGRYFGQICREHPLYLNTYIAFQVGEDTVATSDVDGMGGMNGMTMLHVLEELFILSDQGWIPSAAPWALLARSLAVE